MIEIYEGRISVEISPDDIDRTRIYSSNYDKDNLIKFLVGSIGLYRTENLISELKELEAIIAYGRVTGIFGDRIYTEDLKLSVIWDGIIEALSGCDAKKMCDIIRIFEDTLAGVGDIYDRYIREAHHISDAIPVDFIIKMSESEIKEFIRYDYEEYLREKLDYEKMPDEDHYIAKMMAYDMTVNALKELLRRKRITQYRFSTLKNDIFNGIL